MKGLKSSEESKRKTEMLSSPVMQCYCVIILLLENSENYQTLPKLSFCVLKRLIHKLFSRMLLYVSGHHHLSYRYQLSFVH